ncbi:MAG: NifB/NifX family molybdenum-iron cluster-binding protein [Desulfosarcinaceae bacterium]|jgi:predicted Fe-Mo cluster-binding NifX family protein
MKIAFPTMQDLGLDSPVYNHFGSAATFVIVDTEDDRFDVQSNPDQDHEHGNCQPLAALGGTQVDAVVVGGIGGGALRKLMADGIKIYRAEEGTVAQNLALLKADRLTVFTPDMTCGGHVHIGDKQDGCGHH